MRFSKLIGKPAIFNEENEEYARIRCRDIWSQRYPSESFENEASSDLPSSSVVNELLATEVMKQRSLYSKFLEPYTSEMMYLIAAKQRYKGFLFILGKLPGWNSRFVPSSDILIMLLTHQVHGSAILTVIAMNFCSRPLLYFPIYYVLGLLNYPREKAQVTTQIVLFPDSNRFMILTVFSYVDKLRFLPPHALYV